MTKHKTLKNKIKSLVKEELSKKLTEVAPGTSPNFVAGLKLGQADLDSGTWGNLAEKFKSLGRNPRSRTDVIDFEKGYMKAMQDNIGTLRDKTEQLQLELEKEGFDFEEKVLNKMFPEKTSHSNKTFG